MSGDAIRTGPGHSALDRLATLPKNQSGAVEACWTSCLMHNTELAAKNSPGQMRKITHFNISQLNSLVPENGADFILKVFKLLSQDQNGKKRKLCISLFY